LNPRYTCVYNGFRVRPVQPLRHLSGNPQAVGAAHRRRLCLRWAHSTPAVGAAKPCN